jgi:hypothetical protein
MKRGETYLLLFFVFTRRGNMFISHPMTSEKQEVRYAGEYRYVSTTIAG